MIKIILYTFLAFILYEVVVLVRCAVGLVRVSRALRRSRTILRDGGSSDNDDRHTFGVSVAAIGALSSSALEARLAIDYIYFELIWVADFNEVSGVEAILERYDMSPVDFLPSEGLPLQGVRRVFRSRARRFRRLVIVDCASSSLADCANCATEVASYDLLLVTDNRTRLSSASLTLLVDALLRRSQGGWVMGLAANRVKANELMLTERLLLLAGGGCHSERVGGRVVVPIYLFRRDDVLAQGGFAEDVDVVGAMAQRIKSTPRQVRHAPMRHSPHSHSPAMLSVASRYEGFLPLFVGEVQSADVTARSHSNPLSGWPTMPVVFSQLAVLWFFTVAISALFEGYIAYDLLFVGTLWMVCVLRATLSAIGAVMLSEGEDGSARVKSVAWQIIFSPFLRIRDIMLPKNFVK